MLCGLYSGVVSRANCFAGYNVRQSGGSTVLTPMVNGAEVGTTYTVLDGHQIYVADSVAFPRRCRGCGRRTMRGWMGRWRRLAAGMVDAPMSLCFELVDLGVSSNTPATVLYDTASAGVLAESPASCTFCAVDAVQMYRVDGVLPGDAGWVGVGGEYACFGGAVDAADRGGGGGGGLRGGDLRRAGEDDVLRGADSGGRGDGDGELPAGGAVDCAAGGCGERCGVEKAAGGASGTARWLGRVVSPQARSSVDCESAALAVLELQHGARGGGERELCGGGLL